MDNTNRKKVFYRFDWCAYVLIFIGVMFWVVGLIPQFLTINEHNFRATVNGVVQPYSQESVDSFRMIFLVVFGLVGIILFTIGVVILGRILYKRKLEQSLKDSGEKIMAKVTGCKKSLMQINYRRPRYLICTYPSKMGGYVQVRSKLCMRDPRPGFVDNQVAVYVDRENPKKYFVDVEGSMVKDFEDTW